MGSLDWDYLPGMIDSKKIGKYTAYFTAHRFPRLTCPDEPELVLDEDDEKPRHRAPRRPRDGGRIRGGDGYDGRDRGDDRDAYGGDAKDYGGGDGDG